MENFGTVQVGNTTSGWAAPVATAVGVGGDIFSTMLGIEASNKMAKQNREWQLQQWRMENEYNSPAQQMQRLKAAGLNPNLLYGQISPGNASPVRMNDPYNSKVVAESLSKLNFQGAALQVAKSAQELKALKLANREKQTEIEGKSISNTLQSWLRDAYANYASRSVYLHRGEDLEYYDKENNVYHGAPGSIPFFDRLMSEIGILQARTRDYNTKQELNELKKTTQDLINQWRSTDIEWQPWMRGIEALSTILNSIFGGVRAVYKPH